MSTYIYGSSDDLIEIDGDFSEELDGRTDADILVGIGDNQMLAHIHYDGDWNIKVHPDGNEYDYVIWPVGHAEAERISGRDFSDVLEVLDPVSFVAVGLVVR